jgi:hypothetical protein
LMQSFGPRGAGVSADRHHAPANRFR